ncbi:MAG: hypothetical protein IPG50_36485 [Myxococcales bacterium]|nr:hypothetical protein [Myxococcales bacterium]
MGSRQTWPEIRGSKQYQGRWVALDHCRYDSKTAQPVEGSVVDCDEDLVALCARMQESGSRHCAILFCDDIEVDAPPRSTRLTPIPGRSITH